MKPGTVVKWAHPHLPEAEFHIGQVLVLYQYYAKVYWFNVKESVGHIHVNEIEYHCELFDADTWLSKYLSHRSGLVGD